MLILFLQSRLITYKIIVLIAKSIIKLTIIQLIVILAIEIVLGSWGIITVIKGLKLKSIIIIRTI